MKEIIIIGAGIAGLTCAKYLRKHDIPCTVIEKAGGLGGRVATRRAQGTWFDHGLPFLQKGKDDRYNQWLTELNNQQIIQHWTKRYFQLSSHELEMTEKTPYFCAPQGLTAVAKSLAVGQTIFMKTRITEISIRNDRWHLLLDSGDSFTADLLVATPPAPQAIDLFSNVMVAHNPELLKLLKAVSFHPCITVMASYMNSRLIPREWEIIECLDNLTLELIIANNSKHQGEVNTSLVVHSTRQFANSALTIDDLEAVGKTMLKELGKIIVSALAHPISWQVHRWRFARSDESLAIEYLPVSAPLPLVFAGDWVRGNGIEGAYCSGLAAGNYVADYYRS